MDPPNDRIHIRHRDEQRAARPRLCVISSGRSMAVTRLAATRPENVSTIQVNTSRPAHRASLAVVWALQGRASRNNGIHLCVAAARLELVRPARGHRDEVKWRDARRPRPEGFEIPRVLGVETVPVASCARLAPKEGGAVLLPTQPAEARRDRLWPCDEQNAIASGRPHRRPA